MAEAPDPTDNINPLNKLFVELAQKLSLEEVATMKDLLRDQQLDIQDTESVGTATELFHYLKDRGHIRDDNLDLLLDLFETIKRMPLKTMVIKFLEETGVRGRRQQCELSVLAALEDFQVVGDQPMAADESTRTYYYIMRRVYDSVDLSQEGALQMVEDHLERVGTLIKEFRRSSIECVVWCGKTEVLEKLWGQYKSGELQQVFQKAIITGQLLEKLQAKYITMEVTMSEIEYEQCKEEVKEYEAHKQAKRTRDGSSSSTEMAESNEITVYVGKVGARRRRPLQLRTSNRICHLTEEIQRTFKLSEDDDIIVYQPVEIPGRISSPIPTMNELSEYAEKELVFYVPGSPNLDEIKKMCCGQNIVLIGGAAHGKSSFINTLMKSLEMHPVAPTYGGPVTGTPVYTPYKICLGLREFTLWDVPGATVRAYENEGNLQKAMENIINGKEPPNIKIGDSTRWFSTDHAKIQTVIAVQNGRAGTQTMHSDFLQAVTKTGRAIPMFIVMTHIDEMTPKEIEDARKRIAHEIGVDRSQIFPIANYDHTGNSIVRSERDPQREFYTREILAKVLAASKSYKDETKQTGSCVIS